MTTLLSGRPRNRNSIPRRFKNVFSYLKYPDRHWERPSLPINGEWGALALGLKRLGREAAHWPPSSVGLGMIGDKPLLPMWLYVCTGTTSLIYGGLKYWCVKLHKTHQSNAEDKNEPRFYLQFFIHFLWVMLKQLYFLQEEEERRRRRRSNVLSLTKFQACNLVK